MEKEKERGHGREEKERERERRNGDMGGMRERGGTCTGRE